jgi:hypothetical protein
MNNLWKKTSDDYESSAKVVDGNLILSLPDAINPIVWRMELGSVKASALEVRGQGADGTYMLALKTPKGDVHDIAPFEKRESAVHALMRVSAALQGAEGKISPVVMMPGVAGTQTTQSLPVFQKTGGSAYKWLLALAGVLLVIFLFAYVSSLSPRQAEEGSATEDTSATSVTGEPQSGTDKDGVPQSADQMLRGF